jgi:glycerophosphoryl diester phosphodiesterase
LTKPTITSLNQINPIFIQQYERYLPSAFDPGMSVLQKLNKVIAHLNEMGELTNNVVEQWNSVMEWFLNENVEEIVVEKLSTWMDDGTLEAVIGDSLDYKADKTQITDLQGQINNIFDLTDSIQPQITVKTLQKPVYAAHRGGAKLYPEMSLEGYRSVVSAGINVIEMDVQMLADGTLACNHDDNMSRTTDKAGLVKNFTAGGFISSKINNLPNFTGTPVTMEMLFKEFGNTVVYMPEVKDFEDATSKKLTDMVIRYGLQDNVIIQSFSAPNLSYPVSKGIEVLYLRSNGETDPAVIKGWGFQNVGLSKSNVTDLYVTQCIEEGLKVYIYEVSRRHERWHYNALGVQGFFSDDPIYLSEMNVPKNTDPFNQQVFTPGMLQAESEGDYVDGNRGGFVSPNKFGWGTESDKSSFMLQGWHGTLGDNFTLNLKIDFADVTSEVRWASVAFCTPIDFWNDYNGNSRGYHLLIRESGEMELYKRDDSGSVLMGEVMTTDIVEGTTVSLQIQVTNTQVIAKRLDTSHTLTINSQAYRNGYLHFGRRFTGCYFHDVEFI